MSKIPTNMIGIKSVCIRNFRCFQDFKMDFQKCQALMGENGVGKTTILDAIYLAAKPGYPASKMNEDDFNIEDAGDIFIEVEFDRPFIFVFREGWTDYEIYCQKVRLEVNRRKKASAGKWLSDPIVAYQYAVPDIEKNGNKISLVKETSEEGEIRETFVFKRQKGSDFKFSKFNLTLQNALKNYPDIFYFDKQRERQSKASFNSVFEQIIQNLNWKYRNTLDKTDALSSWNAYYEHLTNKVFDQKKDKVLKPLRERLNKLTGLDFGALEISVLNIEEPFSKSFFSKRFQTNQIAHDKLGSGISMVLTLSLLQMHAKESGGQIITLIDEPEIHLHPQLQATLFGHFCEDDNQIIYTTHSEIFADLAEWRSIARIYDQLKYPNNETLSMKFKDGSTVEGNLNDIKKFCQHQKIFAREDNQLFFAKKCLLVEGANDKYGIPILAEILKIELKDVTVIMCRGKPNIRTYKLLCMAYGIPAFVVYDKDEHLSGKEKQNNEETNDFIDSMCDDDVFAFSTSFEKIVFDGLGISKNNLLNEISSANEANIPKEIGSCISKIEKWAKSVGK